MTKSTPVAKPLPQENTPSAFARTVALVGALRITIRALNDQVHALTVRAQTAEANARALEMQLLCVVCRLNTRSRLYSPCMHCILVHSIRMEIGKTRLVLGW